MAFLWLINRGDPNHLLTGMILQVTRKKISQLTHSAYGDPKSTRPGVVGPLESHSWKNSGFLTTYYSP